MQGSQVESLKNFEQVVCQYEICKDDFDAFAHMLNQDTDFHYLAGMFPFKYG